MSFPAGYHQPKFQMFDGSGDPDQHLAHFTSASGDTVRNGSLLLRQFVLSLTGPAFDWYSKLPSNSIPDWPSMKAAFLNHFYSTRRTVSLKELSTMGQKDNEAAADYIR